MVLKSLFKIPGKKKKNFDNFRKFRIMSPGLINLPGIENFSNVDIIYPLIKPFSNAHIIWNDETKELIYVVEEPELGIKERKLFSQIKSAMEEKIEISTEDIGDELLIEYLEEKFMEVLEELAIDIEEEVHLKFMYYIYRDFVGLNEIEPLMFDPYIEDISCDGVSVPVFIKHSKFGNLKTNLIFEDAENLKNLVIKLAEKCNRFISYAEPLLDGTLKNGSRVQATLTEDITTKGPTFSIRKFRGIPYSCIDLINLNTANEEIMAYMWLLIENRRNILIIGGTSTGKTTFLNAILSFLPPENKVVSIEDTRELKLVHENWIPAVARTGYYKYGEITMFDLLKESFRQNPDYLIIGEVRGKEAYIMFHGMASGNNSLGTMHASSPQGVIERLITPPINLAPSLIETLDVILVMTHARILGRGARRVEGIYEVQDVINNSLRSNQIFSWTPVDDTFYFRGIKGSYSMDEIQKRTGMGIQEIERSFEEKKKLLREMRKKGITKFEEVSKIISRYYKEREKLLSEFAENPFEGQEIEIKEDPFKI